MRRYLADLLAALDRIATALESCQHFATRWHPSVNGSTRISCMRCGEVLVDEPGGEGEG